MNRKINILFILFPLGFLFYYQPVSAQTHHIIRGKVTDATTNLPIAGVTVQAKGASAGTTTDDNGAYTLDVIGNGNPVIVFSYVGYQGHEMKVGNSGLANISLQSGTSSLNEVVVTAYSSEKKKDITGAVSVVNMDNLSRQPESLVTEQLQGQASGVTVITSGQPGADPQVRIRGINTFGNNSPLYVVDGVPTQNIADLNVNDIASMQVLKDAGAASIYGSRASNGVVIITTKRGNSNVMVHYDGYYGVQIPKSGNVWNLLNPQEEANLTWIALKNSGQTNPSSTLYGNGATPVLPDYVAPVGAMAGDSSVNPALYNVNPNYTDINEYNNFYRITPANKSGTDWYHQVFKNAPMQSHNISVSGGGDKGSYLFSMSYLNQQGSLINTYLKRYTIRSNSQYIVSKNIRIGENLETSITHNPTISDIPTDGNLQGTSAIFYTMQISPIIPVYDIKGNYGGVYGTGLNGPNPVAIQQRTANNQDVQNRLLGNVYADVQFLKYFTFHTSFGGDNFSGAAHSFNYPTYENSGNNTVNSFTQSSYNGFNWTWTNTLTYAKQFGADHHLSVMIGTEAYKAQTESLTGTTQSYLSFDPNYTTLSSGSGVQTNGSGRTMESLSSIFGRVDYSYKDKYLFNATLRRDGSSKFVTYQYGWFPAVSAGWRISQEDFMKNAAWVTDLKLRGSWGVMGNQLNVNGDNGYYTYVLNINEAYYDIAGTNNINQSGLQVGQIGNPNAKWEKDYSTNIGFDATLWNGRFSLTADYYQKNIEGLLYNPSEPGTAGLGNAPFINVAGVKNNGFDMSLTYHHNFSKKLKLDAGFILTTYHNVITQVTDQANYFWTNDQRHYGSDFIRNQVGHAIGSFYGYQIAGFWNSAADIAAADLNAQKATGNASAVYQPDEAVGRFRYADVNGDNQITDSDRTFLGNPNPKFSYGLNLHLTYGQFDMSMFFYGVQGNNLWNVTKFWTDFSGFAEAKSKTALYDSWSPTHQNAKVSIPETGQYQSTNGAPNSYYVENGSYLKLKNIEIGYTLPASMLKKIGIDRFRIYIQAANVFTITKYSGVDPEISGSVTDFGVDEGIYPNMRQFLGGISLTF
jgi:TonB-linked SusC/RagA family outer membrane protein